MIAPTPNSAPNAPAPSWFAANPPIIAASETKAPKTRPMITYRSPATLATDRGPTRVMVIIRSLGANDARSMPNAQCRMHNAQQMLTAKALSIAPCALRIEHWPLALSRSSEHLDVVGPARGIAREADADFRDAGAQDVCAVTGGAHPRVHRGG